MLTPPGRFDVHSSSRTIGRSQIESPLSVVTLDLACRVCRSFRSGRWPRTAANRLKQTTEVTTRATGFETAPSNGERVPRDLEIA